MIPSPVQRANRTRRNSPLPEPLPRPWNIRLALGGCDTRGDAAPGRRPPGAAVFEPLSYEIEGKNPQRIPQSGHQAVEPSARPLSSGCADDRNPPTAAVHCLGSSGPPRLACIRPALHAAFRLRAPTPPPSFDPLVAFRCPPMSRACHAIPNAKPGYTLPNDRINFHPYPPRRRLPPIHAAALGLGNSNGRTFDLMTPKSSDLPSRVPRSAGIAPAAAARQRPDPGRGTGPF